MSGDPPCNCFYVGDFPTPCHMHCAPTHRLHGGGLGVYTIQAPVPSLSDADVERIARRVAELIKAAP